MHISAPNYNETKKTIYDLPMQKRRCVGDSIKIERINWNELSDVRI